MICYIYRSPKKDQMYLYVQKKDCFEDVPEQLLTVFGTPDFSMMIDLSTRKKLARTDINQVSSDLTSKGYHLQMPPELEKLEF